MMALSKLKTCSQIACILMFSMLLSTQKTVAQDRDLSKLSFGIQLQNVQNNLGVGVHILSPTFLENFRVKNSYSLSFLPHLNNDSLSTWTAYHSLNFGTRYQFTVSNTINVYVELGSQILISPSSISSEQFNFGGYGAIGFEVFVVKPVEDSAYFTTANTSFFIELGGAGNNSKADRVLTKPKIATGFSTSVGFRF
ncbi:MAG: hypothetical protein ACPG5W_11260 [Flavobacteriales bacterium]